MNKRVVRHIAEACVFLLAIGALLYALQEIVERKKSRDLLGGYLVEPQAYDVIFFGDSLFMNAMLPMEMWEDYGIAGYNLSCYGNVMPISYWTMINAFDYAEPELVVLGVNGMNESHKVSNYSGDLHTALDFWPLTRNKARMISDLLDDPMDPDYTDIEGNRYRDLKPEFYFTLAKYHSRWSELTQADFAPRPAHGRGGEALVGVAPIWEYELIDENSYADEGGYSYAYLRKAIEECIGRGIRVLLVHLPAPQYVDSQKHAHTASSIAQEFGVDFLDVTSLDSIVDYAVDCVDSDPHLNLSGSLKMTSYLGSYLAAHYDLPDRREDAAYAHWHEHLDAHKLEKRALLEKEEDLNNLLMLLHDEDYDVEIIAKAQAPIFYDDVSVVLMHNIVRERVLAGEEEEKWSNVMYPLEGFDEALALQLDYCLSRQGDLVTEQTGEDARQAVEAAFDGDDASTLLIEAHDRRTGETVISRRF